MVEPELDVRADSLLKRPRSVRKHPLLAKIYEHHDELISEFLPDGSILEIASGQYMHPRADVGLEALASNIRELDRTTTVGDARSLPFSDDSFEAIIGRRFLHHVPVEGRREIMQEAARVLKPGGRVVLLEGTPGLYRRLVKGAAFRLGILGDDTDIYGHISQAQIHDLVAEEFDVVEVQSLGSPLAIASIAESELSTKLFPLYRQTQFIKWWSIVVGEVPD